MNAHYPDFTLPSVVIVDDCDDDVFLLRHRLREAGVTNPIVAFSSPADALAFLRSAEERNALPVIVFTDIRMPVECGFTLIAAIRENSAWNEIRIAVVTSSNTTTDLERALELGANGYAIKFPPSDLLGDFVRNGPWFAIPHRVTEAVNALSA